MRVILIGIILALTTADHWTTYVCLSGSVPGWSITEANPVAAWLFQTAGLVPGLFLDSLATLAALAFLVSTQRFSPRVKLALLTAVAITTGYAVMNNLAALSELGLSALGTA